MDEYHPGVNRTILLIEKTLYPVAKSGIEYLGWQYFFLDLLVGWPGELYPARQV
jgi:hypothetical protein